ncbi:unnamed protein product [Leuciscus chuanchicus]
MTTSISQSVSRHTHTHTHTHSSPNGLRCNPMSPATQQMTANLREYFGKVTTLSRRGLGSGRRVTKTDAWLDTGFQVHTNCRHFPGELEGGGGGGGGRWEEDRWCTLEGQDDRTGATK